MQAQYDKFEQLAFDAELAVAILGNPETSDFELVALAPGPLPDKHALHERGNVFCRRDGSREMRPAHRPGHAARCCDPGDHSQRHTSALFSCRAIGSVGKLGSGAGGSVERAWRASLVKRVVLSSEKVTSTSPSRIDTSMIFTFSAIRSG